MYSHTFTNTVHKILGVHLSTNWTVSSTNSVLDAYQISRQSVRLFWRYRSPCESDIWSHACVFASSAHKRVSRCGPCVRYMRSSSSPQSGHFIFTQTHTAGFVWFAKSMQPHRNKSNHEDARGLNESNVEFEFDANHCFCCMTLCDHFLIQSKPFCHQKLLILFCTRSTFD